MLNDDGRPIIRHHGLYQPAGERWLSDVMPIIGDIVILFDDGKVGEYRVVERRFSNNGSLVDYLVEQTVPMNAEEGPLTQAELDDE